MKTMIAVLAIVLMSVQGVLAQDEMTRDQWQEEMKNVTAKRTELQGQLAKLDQELTALKGQSTKLDADVLACEEALFAMLGVSRGEFEAYEKDLAAMEKRVAELQGMSDAQLLAYKDELMQIDAKLKEMAKSKIALIPRYGTRVQTLQAKLDALMQSLQREKTYTVGTWSRDRDCLWNIAKKKDTYANAWMWPKIWQGNRDKIKDPDLIKPKWVLKIPDGKELSKEEKRAANTYYRKKAAEPEPAGPGQ
jgi:nucleoid-associated protein YgaU